MSEPTAQEVLMLSLINRARLDPLGEAARMGIALDEGLAPGTLDTKSRQALAFSNTLQDASEQHSQAMIDNDFFAHNNPFTGSTPQTRANAAGYAGLVGENISWRGSTAAIDATDMIGQQHASLFIDANVAGRGHRLNILDDRYQQIGIGQVLGQFTRNGSTFNASMITQDFGIPNAPGQFLTGTVFTDTDNNDFYSVGEGKGGVQIATAAGNTATGAAGAYARQIGTGGQSIIYSGGGLPAAVEIKATITEGRNALINLIDNTTIETSVSVREVSNVSTIRGVGTNNLVLTGAAGSDNIFGSVGHDKLSGGADADYMAGFKGNDTYYVSNSGDVVDESLAGSNGVDKVFSSVTFSLADAAHAKGKIENLELTGTGNIKGTGNALNNVMTGNSGNNVLNGGGGHDKLDGGLGKDTLSGGTGNDTMTGGADADVFLYVSGGFGQDRITDFQDGIDKLKFFSTLADSFADFDILSGNGTNQVVLGLHADPSQTVTLQGASPITISASDFVFF